MQVITKESKFRSNKYLYVVKDNGKDVSHGKSASWRNHFDTVKKMTSYGTSVSRLFDLIGRGFGTFWFDRFEEFLKLSLVSR